MSKFVFTEENGKKLEALIRRYPEGRAASAATGAMYLALRQEGCVSDAALETIAEILSVPYSRLWTLRSFYDAFNDKPAGRVHVSFCRGICCGMKGADEVRDACLSHMKIKTGETRADGMFSAEEKDCLGACLNAPAMLVNGVCCERLTPESAVEILKKYEAEAEC